MSFFTYRDSNLHCEETDLSAVVKDISTPFYLYSYRSIITQARAIDAVFDEVSHLVCYSMKSNSNLAVCRMLAEEGMGADTVSSGEIYKALNAGFTARKIVFSGVGKSDYDIRFALRNDILSINVDSLEELAVVNEIAGQMKKTAPIAFRINPNIDPKTHPYISTGLRENKFGIDFDEALAAYRQAQALPHVKIMGMAYHIGSQITEIGPFIASAQKAAQLVKELAQAGITLNFVDIGGGLGITYDREAPPALDQLKQELVPILKNTHCRIICEPGRFIVGNAGILVTKVLYVKRKSNKTFVIVDAGMNDLIRPALYEAYHGIQPLVQKSGPREKVDVVGPICESSDCFAREREMVVPSRGDFLAIMSAGAYGYSMASNYNCRLRPAEVMVNKENYFTIRDREILTDLIGNDESWMMRFFE
jgi:diaminopimelate decarboxylase